MKIHCPAHVEFLMHCHCSPEPFERWGVPMFMELASVWTGRGIIRRTTNEAVAPVYTTTDLGKAWVNAICNTPLPKQVFVDEMGRVL